MSSPLMKSPAPAATGHGVKFGDGNLLVGGTVTIPPRKVQVLAPRQISDRRSAWIHDALADLELTGVSCLLRAPRGGEALEILDRCRDTFVIPKLADLVHEIDRKYALRLWRGWEQLRDSYDSDELWPIRMYAHPQPAYTDREAAAHQTLLQLAYCHEVTQAFSGEGGADIRNAA